MKELIENFPAQLKEALEIGKSIEIRQADNTIKNVVITGLGGSGIGGGVVSDTIGPEATVPIVINKDYALPNWVNHETLVIVCSYSGNTEETLSAMEKALQAGCHINCVTSGGKIHEIAETNNLDCVVIPGGLPPRAAMGYSFSQLYFILNKHWIISDSFLGQLERSISLLESEKDEIITLAKDAAEKLLNKIPVIYSASSCENVAVRFKQQVNENSKMLCWQQPIPEMNHNELVGWTKEDESLAVVIFRNKSDFSRTQTRIEISKEICSKYTTTIIELWSKGDSAIENAVYLIHLGDWISWFLADLKQIDAVEVDVITFLKNELAKV